MCCLLQTKPVLRYCGDTSVVSDSPKLVSRNSEEQRSVRGDSERRLNQVRCLWNFRLSFVG